VEDKQDEEGRELGGGVEEAVRRKPSMLILATAVQQWN